MKRLGVFALLLSAWAHGQPISQLPAASALNGSETLPCVQAGTTKKCSVSQVTSQTTSTLAPSATVDTTNASNITNGTLPVGQIPLIPLGNLPGLTNNVTLVCDATCGNQTLSGICFIDGKNCFSGAGLVTYVLLTAQGNKAQNGIWAVPGISGNWYRPNFYQSGSITQAFYNLTVFVTYGDNYQGTTWYLAAANPITIDTTQTEWFKVPVYVVATGTTNGRSVDERAADTANVLDYGAFGTTIRRQFFAGTGITTTQGSNQLTLSTPLPAAYSTANIFVTGAGNPGATAFTFATPGSGYVPQSLLTCSGGTGTACQILLYSTAVQSATVVSGGSCTVNGTQTVTGTTGLAGTTGSAYFTASVTVSGGTITAVDSVTANGPYYQNPNTVTDEPVTGGNCTGATLSVGMGANTGVVYTAGNYTAIPANPVSTTATSGSGATLNVTWGGNPLVTTVSSISGDSVTLTANAASSQSLAAGWVYAWPLNQTDEVGIAAAFNSGKSRIYFPNPPQVGGTWQTGYCLDANITIPGNQPLNVDGGGNFVAACSSAVTNMFIASFGVFRGGAASHFENFWLDGLGLAGRGLDLAAWDWIASGNYFENFTTAAVGFEGSHSFENHLAYFTINSDTTVMLTYPMNGVDVENQDNRIEHGTVVGVANCPINVASVGDINILDVHVYGNLENSFCYGSNGVLNALYADSTPPSYAGIYWSGGYGSLNGLALHLSGNTYAGQQGVLLTSTAVHNVITGIVGGSAFPSAQTCTDQSSGGTNIWMLNQNCNLNKIPAFTISGGTLNIGAVSGAGAASKYVCVDSSGNVLIQSAAC